MGSRPNSRVHGLLAASAPDSVAMWIRRYLEALTVRHCTVSAVAHRRSRLAHFNTWCVEHGIEQPVQVNYTIMARFQRYLFFYRTGNGLPLSVNGQVVSLQTVQMFFRWLVRHHHLPSNPAMDLELPRRTEGLREPLTGTEVVAVLALPDLNTTLGLRDRAILELFYATGLRRTEMVNVWVSDIEPERGTLHVRLGKGGKDRFVPVGERALAWLAKYQRDVRPLLLAAAHGCANAASGRSRHPASRDTNASMHGAGCAGAAEPRLFVNTNGQPLSPDGLSWRVRMYFEQIGVVRRGSCHLFRHTMATAMLDNGADIRHVQEMLGHRQIGTTQRYTHVSIAKLKAVHAATHPAAKLTRSAAQEIDGEA